MKKLSYLSMIALASFAFQACNNQAKDGTETADSTNMATDTTINSNAANGTAVSDDDAAFASKAAVGGMAEVDFGKLALSKTANAQIKEFANMMVNDHGKANDELKAIAGQKNITLPASLDEDHQKVANDLNAASGKDFDKKYVDAMVDGHKKTLDLMEKEAKDGQDADLKAFAAKTAPVVKGHLTMIEKIAAAMK